MKTVANNSEQVADIIISGIEKKWNILQLSRMLGKTVAETSRLIGMICKSNPVFAKKILPLKWPTNITSGHIYTDAYSTPVIANPAIYKKRDEIIALIKNQMIKADPNFLIKAKELTKELAYLKENSPTTGGSVVHGVRLGTLKPGAHVFTKPILGKPYSEVYLAVSTKQYLFVFENPEKDKQLAEMKKELEDKTKNSCYVLTNIDRKKQEYIDRISKSKEAWFSREDVINGKLAEYSLKHQFTWVRRAKAVRTVYTPDKTSQGAVHNRYLISVNSNGT